MTVLEGRGLSRRYVLGEEIWAVKDVDLALAPGELVVVAGPSGCGKTTLLSLLGAMDRPTSGEVYLQGRGYSRLGPAGLARVRRQHVGFVFQGFHLIPHLRAWENVVLPLRMTGVRGRAARRRALELLESVGLAERAQHLPGELSGGEQQRVAVARALANRPLVVLADEPTGNLDVASGRAIAALFDRFRREGTTFLVVTHHRETFAPCATRVLEMRDGRLYGPADPTAGAGGPAARGAGVSSEGTAGSGGTGHGR
ncbi:MAG: ABC transporter ATP-binding protein [Bacillota bacterium]|nr:ABC transporter ATP-binding protein [Bacillota bacterium]